MNRSRNVLVICVIGVLLVVSACSGSPASPDASARTGATASASVTPASSATQGASAATPTVAPTATTPATPAATLDPTSYALAEPGPYGVGYRPGIASTDDSRGGRSVGVTVWYPAQLPPGFSGETAAVNAEPDRGGAPYPLILSSTKLATRLAPLVVSHGFVWASVDGIDSYAKMNPEMLDQPLDILFALDMVASSPPEGLEGMIDSEHAGVIGYSFDGYNAYALGGARIDPEYYLAQCPTMDDTTEAILGGQLSAFSCDPAEEWDAFSARAGEAITTSEDGLWQPITDERIRAVMPMAGEGWWLFGERGLAAADRPTLVIVATGDELYSENALMFGHLGAPEKALISFVGPDHMMIFDPEMQARMAHFAAAFFGYYLQGREDLAWFFSEGFVSGHKELAWGAPAGQ